MRTRKVTLSAEGLCTLALKYDGAEIYWWDLENLDPESDEYQAYESLRTKGEIRFIWSRYDYYAEEKWSFCTFINLL